MVRPASVRIGALGLDDTDLASCVSCGLCLPHCPTWRVTGDESASPRGRIAAMRAVQWDGAPMDSTFERFMDLCVQCRGCETACPADVPFGRLMEGSRQTLAEETRYHPWWRRLGYRGLGHHRLVLAGSTALAIGQRLRLVPSRFGFPMLPLRRRRLRASGSDVWLFTGCVMDAWQRDIHAAVIRVLEAAGAGVALPGSAAGCCGALHSHAGLVADARRLAARTMTAFPGDAPILVDSAGCGAALAAFGHLLGSAAAVAFSARVLDVHEWLAPRIEGLALRATADPAAPRPHVAIQDACHLRHVQRAHQHVRTVLAPFATLAELDDDGLCCGAGGAYSVMHPEMAGDIRLRKLAAIGRTGAPIVASANPGCALHLAAAGLDVRHPLEIVDEAISPHAPHRREAGRGR